jgi:hypothetical protein
MNKMELIFSKCILDSQEYGSDNEHMVSRVYFSIDGEEYECNVRQPYGESFSFENDPIEVETPEELKGKVNYGQFRDEVENYYRKLVGANASSIRIQGAPNVRMSGITFTIAHTATIDKAGMSGGW